MHALYAACVSFADACGRRKACFLAIALPVYGVLVVAVGRALQAFPNSGDEYVYLYQAATLAEGRVSNPAPPLADAFAFNYIAHEHGRLFGTFPPGWPLALALASWVCIPASLVNPLAGAASLVAVWALGRRLYGERAGVLAAVLTVSSAFFLFNAASFFSHTWCGLLLLLAAYAAASSRPGSVAWPAAAGCLIGWAVVTRYLTGTIGGAAVATLLVQRTRPHHVRGLAAAALGGLPWVAGLAAYNVAVSGSAWRLTTLDATLSLWFAPGFALRGPDILATQVLRFLLWTPAALLAAYLYYLRRSGGGSDPGLTRVRPACAGRRAGLLHWMFVWNAAVLVFYVNRGGNQYGPRFYYEAFLFLVIFTAAALVREADLLDKSRTARGLFAAMAVSVALTPALIWIHGRQATTVIRERSDVYRRVAAANLDDAIVLLDGRVGTERSMDVRDLTRNGIEYRGDVLFALDRGRAANCALAAAYRPRGLYRYVWHARERRGELTPVGCTR